MKELNYSPQTFNARRNVVLGIVVEILLCSETEQKIVTNSPTTPRRGNTQK